MSLLDFKPPELNTPEGQGLMAAAMSLLQARRRPGERGIAGALGQAGQQFMDTRNQSQQMQRRQLMNDLAMKGRQLQLDQTQEARAWQQQMNALLQSSKNPDGTFDFTKYQQGLASLDPMAALDLQARLSTKKAPIKVGAGESLVNPDTFAPVYTAPAKPESLPSAIQEYEYAKRQGYGGTFEQWDTARKRAGAPSVNNTVSVAGPENKYNQVVGEGLGKTGLETVETAKAAPEVIRNARMVRTAIEAGAITGTGAEARLAVQKALETAGLVGPGKAANTQALMAGLGKITLASIKSSGLGAGQGFTNTDREFLQNASSGTIDSTPDNLLRVAELSERVATSSHQKGLKVLERWRADPALRAVAQDTHLDPIPEEMRSGPAMSSLPPAQAHKGRVIRDTITGKLLVSNGMTWVEKR